VTEPARGATPTGNEVLLERRRPVAVLTFNRPEKLNALSSGLLDRFEVMLDEVERDDGVRAVVLTGAGERAFVAGADIEEYSRQSDEEFAEYQLRSRRLFSRIDDFPKPVVAAVNGYALGGGFEIALACDLIVASPSARFGLPEGLLGLSPGGGGTQRLTKAVGPFVAARVLLAADRLSAEEMLALGLVARLTDDDVIDEAVALAEQIARVAPLASAEMRSLIRAALDRPLEDGLTLEQEALHRLRASRDAHEGVHAFVEKRDPSFEGR
jgi:enoyl-CoA hydratase/carnithine racemase